MPQLTWDFGGDGAGPSMQRICDFSVPGGKIRVIRQILITKQQYLAVDNAYRYVNHSHGSEKFIDDKKRADRFNED